MKTPSLFACVFGLAAASVASGAADAPASPAAPAAATVQAPAQPAADAPQALSPVASALSKLTFMSDVRPRLDAKYYIFLHSASWCGACIATMPTVVETIKEMEAEKAPIGVILCCYDRTAAAGVEYSKENGHAFPLLMDGSPGVYDIPGNQRATGIPDIRIISADGELVFAGLGKKIADWKTIIAEYEEKKKG